MPLMLIVPGLLQLFTSAIIPVAGLLLQFTLPRLARIPLYIRLLLTIYQDTNLDAEARKYLTSAMLILGSILTFMAYSYVPLTGVPVIGLLTTPVAGVIAIVVSLISLDTIFALNGKYLHSKYPDEFTLIRSDIGKLASVLGKSWEETVKQTQALLDTVKKQIDPNRNYDDTILALMNALISYLGTPQDDGSLPPNEINRLIVTEGLPPIAKVGGAVAEGLAGGAIAGAAAHGLAANMFVQAGFWANIKAAVGLGGGIIVGAPAFAGLVVAAPIGLAVIAGAGICQGAMFLRNEGEKQKLSAFLADVLIAALPMAWVDGNFSAEEQDTIEKFLLNSGINTQDAKRIRETMNRQKSFDEILHAGLLKEENPQKARMKHRLLLCTTWELAKADGVISSDEISLHNRMAKFMNIEKEEIDEIRRLILLKSGISIRDRINVVRGDITKQSVDAVVNSANKTLLPGNKLGWLPLPEDRKRIDTAIHRAAGSGLYKECQSLKSCSVGEAKITQGYELPTRWVIHTVSPTLTAGNTQEKELLAQCYRNSLILAHQRSIHTIAFPALGTGTGRFPVDQAARVAIAEVQQFLNTHFSIEQVKFICSDEQTYQGYVQAVEEVIGYTSTEHLGQAMTSSASVTLSA